MQAIVQCTNITNIDSLVTEISELKSTKDFYLITFDDANIDAIKNIVISFELVDTNVKFMSTLSGTDIDKFFAEDNWGRKRLVTRTYQENIEFAHADTTFFAKPEVYVMDSGIDHTHADLYGVESTDFYKAAGIPNWSDTAGHGTAVASAIAGAATGVHRHLKLMNVQITTDSYKPTLLELSDAFNAILDRHVATPMIPKIVNCSWTINRSQYIDALIESLMTAGIAVVAAGGNSGINADDLSPAGIPNVITVGASDIDDFVAGFNNYSTADMTIDTNDGQTIDLFAPGVDVSVAVPPVLSQSGYKLTSGTSISSGYVSGCLAALMSMIPDVYGPSSKQILLDMATTSMLLYDTTKFEEEQNKIAFLASASNAAMYQDLNVFLYLFDKDSTPGLFVRFQDIISTDPADKINNETDRVMQFEYPDVETKNILDQYVSFDLDSDVVSINKPQITFAPGEDMKLLSFRIKATYPSVTYYSSNLLLYVVDPNANTDDLIDSMNMTLSEMDAIRLYDMTASGTQK